MPDMREGDLGTAACYLMVERLALQAGVESPLLGRGLVAHGRLRGALVQEASHAM